ncbi:hypothetical protein [Microcoleus vaginatus]|uniref:hypothetical protein n=1 Tax=Microcoleus vaginatus TaxID=119532 RepID=UPI00020D3017|nr:hypothetical protein MicvaDRAFT_1725 [Microcoleus vaginatus FGP-2]
MPVPQENSPFVEQASCLLIKLIENGATSYFIPTWFEIAIDGVDRSQAETA